MPVLKPTYVICKRCQGFGTIRKPDRTDRCSACNGNGRVDKTTGKPLVYPAGQVDVPWNQSSRS